MQPRAGAWWDSLRIGIGPPLLKTEHGWLLIYHGVKETVTGGMYRVGLALLDLADPRACCGAAPDWVFGPLAEYERIGDVPNALFPCGLVHDRGTRTLRLYYGAADTSIGLATAKLDDLLDAVLEQPGLRRAARARLRRPRQRTPWSRRPPARLSRRPRLPPGPRDRPARVRDATARREPRRRSQRWDAPLTEDGARSVVAREHGFADWAAFERHVAALRASRRSVRPGVSTPSRRAITSGSRGAARPVAGAGRRSAARTATTCSAWPARPATRASSRCCSRAAPTRPAATRTAGRRCTRRRTAAASTSPRCCSRRARRPTSRPAATAARRS